MGKRIAIKSNLFYAYAKIDGRANGLPHIGIGFKLQYIKFLHGLLTSFVFIFVIFILSRPITLSQALKSNLF